MAKDYDRQEVYRIAEAYRAKRKYKKALKEYEKILAVDSEDIKVIAKVADLYHLTKDFTAAVKLYDRLATAYFQEELLDKVVAIRKQLVELDSKNIKRHIDLADLLVIKGLQADAITTYRHSLKRFTGRRYLQARQQILESILKLKADDFSARYLLVKIYKQQQMIGAAKKLLLHGLSLMLGRQRRRWRWRYQWQLFRLSPSWRHFIAIFIDTQS